MAYKVTISDGTILEKSIESVTFNADTPSDDSYCMRTYTINSMTITGKIDAGEKTISLYKWALLPANNCDCYKEIVVEYIHAGQTIRNVKFSKAFVVDYSESYSKDTGVGHFTIFIRQLSEVDIECANEVAQQSTAIETAPTNVVEESSLPQVLEMAVTATSIAKKDRPKATDILANIKKLQDNSNAGVSEVVRDDKYWNTIDQYGSTPKERLDQTPINNGTWNGERGESKWICTLPDVQEQYKQYGVDGIEYKNGLPDFSPISQFNHLLPEKPIDLVTAKDDDQFDECTKALKKYVEGNPEETKRKFNEKQLNQIKAGKKPSGFTWHHSVERGKMELVPTRIHQNSGHYGGKNIWGGGSANR